MTRCRRRGGAATIYSKAHKIAASICQSALAKASPSYVVSCRPESGDTEFTLYSQRPTLKRK